MRIYGILQVRAFVFHFLQGLVRNRLILFCKPADYIIEFVVTLDTRREFRVNCWQILEKREKFRELDLDFVMITLHPCRQNR